MTPFTSISSRLLASTVFLLAFRARVGRADNAAPPLEVTDKVWMDVEIGGVPIGRIEIGLFRSIVPKSVENFAQLSTRPQGQGFKGTHFHRVIKNFMIQAGDMTHGDGTGGRSIYVDGNNPWGFFEDENFTVKHTGAGWVSYANSGKDSNRSQFFITTRKTAMLNGKHVCFGKVLKGMEVVRKIAATPVNPKDKKPLSDVVIVNSGHEVVARPFVVAEGDAKE